MARCETLFRQWELVRALQTCHYGLTVDELAERLECNKRTIQRDLAALQDLLPVTYESREQGKRFWKLSNQNVDGTKLDITITEMLSLFLSQQLLLPLSGTQFGDGLQSLLQKIRAIIPTKALDYFENLDSDFFFRAAASHDYSSQDTEIRLLNKAIINQTAIKVNYDSQNSGEMISGEFHPYGMVLFQASLYYIGYLVSRGEIRTLNVARLRKVSATQKEFVKPDDFLLSEYCRHSFGIIRHECKLQKIHCEFTGWAATNVKEISWHPSQKIVSKKKDHITTTFELNNTVEFKRWILGFGQNAIVLSPQSLADEIMGEFTKGIENYAGINK